MPTYTVKMSDRDDAGEYIERTVQVDAVNTSVARLKALALHGSDEAEAVSVRNADYGAVFGETVRRVSVTIDAGDTMSVELADVDGDDAETVVSTTTSHEPGVWAAVQSDEDLWTWAESRGLCPECEHSTRGRYSMRDGRETFAVSGPVLP